MPLDRKDSIPAPQYQIHDCLFRSRCAYPGIGSMQCDP